MSSSSFYILIISILIVQFIVELVLNFLNAKHFNNNIPEELVAVFNEKEYYNSQTYKKTNYRFDTISNTFSFILTLSFLCFGGFNWASQLAEIQTQNSILQALFFFGIIILGSSIITLPFSYYKTFIIEEKFGFNKSTKKLFFIDKIKSLLMTIILGGLILSALIYFIAWTGTYFWIYAWLAISILTLFMNLFYSKLIVPLFNKQKPLEAGPLKEEIDNYAKKEGFKLDNIFVIDGSKRSTKANAYFSGFGKEKRVTLYDTLINDLNTEEIVAVLAHEIGHYKKKHIIFNLILSILITGLTLFILSLFINNPNISLAIGVTKPSIHAALLGFGILYSPISELTSLVMNYISRKFEYQADNFAKDTYTKNALISGLKKLSKNSLSNLTPHPAYVFMYYSHPPLIDRIRNIMV